MKQGTHTPPTGTRGLDRGLRSDPSAAPGRTAHTSSRDVVGKIGPNARAREASPEPRPSECRLFSYYVLPQTQIKCGSAMLLRVVSSQDDELNHYYIEPSR